MDNVARTPTRTPDQPYAAELDAEREGWYELAELVRALTPEECLVPGYYRDPDWTVRDAVAHLGTWLAKAAGELERLLALRERGALSDAEFEAAKREVLAGR